MAHIRLRLVSSQETNSVALQYENIIAKAERAYLFGQQAQVQLLYRQAFGLSIKILNSSKANRVSFERLVNVCHCCFDFCPLPKDSDAHYFLEIAAASLATIVTTRADKEMRIQALSAYSSIANLAAKLVNYNHSSRAYSIVVCFQQLQDRHG